MEAVNFSHIGVLLFQGAVVCALVLLLYRVRGYFGLTMLAVAVGVFQHVQVNLAQTLYFEIVPGFLVSPGSVVLFPVGLLAVLLVYIQGDAPEARRLCYGVVAANLVFSGFSYIFAVNLDAPGVHNFFELPRSWFVQETRIMLAGSFALVFDFLLVILVYEALYLRLRRHVFLHLTLSLGIVLIIDTFVFATLAFYGKPQYLSVMVSGGIGKAVMGMFYAALTTAYLRWLDSRDGRPPFTLDASLKDVFHFMTFRQKYETAQDLNEQLQVANVKLEVAVSELARARDRAESADRIKSVFLATMSHELRTPLNAIIGFTGMLQKGRSGPVNDQQERQLGMVMTSARHLLDLINEVLDLSKIESGQMEFERTRFPLDAALSEGVELVRPAADVKGLKLKYNPDPAIGEICSDRRRILQVVINLLNNAVKFTDEGAVSLNVWGDPANGTVKIAVADTGIGIRPEDVDKLFVPFHQLDDGRSRKHEGTGLGLSICKKLLACLDGEISVSSRAGEGTTFTVTLPLEPAGAERESQPELNAS